MDGVIQKLYLTFEIYNYF